MAKYTRKDGLTATVVARNEERVLYNFQYTENKSTFKKLGCRAPADFDRDFAPA